MIRLRHLSRKLLPLSRALSDTAAAQEIPNPEPCGKRTFSPKIQKLVEEISQLSLLEVVDLNELLKVTLKLPEISFAAAGAVPVQKEAEEESDVETKSSFTVRLTGFQEGKKVGLIKEIKNIKTELNLVQAKKFVESVPQIIRDNIGKEEAEKLMKQLEALGGICEIE